VSSCTHFPPNSSSKQSTQSIQNIPISSSLPQSHPAKLPELPTIQENSFPSDISFEASRNFLDRYGQHCQNFLTVIQHLKFADVRDSFFFLSFFLYIYIYLSRLAIFFPSYLGLVCN